MACGLHRECQCAPDPNAFKGIDAVVEKLPELAEILWRLGSGKLPGMALLAYRPSAWWDGRAHCALGHVEENEAVVSAPLGVLTRLQMEHVVRELGVTRFLVHLEPKTEGQRMSATTWVGAY